MTRTRSYRIITAAAALLAALGAALATTHHASMHERADTVWTGSASPTGTGTVTPQDTIWTG